MLAATADSGGLADTAVNLILSTFGATYIESRSSSYLRLAGLLLLPFLPGGSLQRSPHGKNRVTAACVKMSPWSRFQPPFPLSTPGCSELYTSCSQRSDVVANAPPRGVKGARRTGRGAGVSAGRAMLSTTGQRCVRQMPSTVASSAPAWQIVFYTFR